MEISKRGSGQAADPEEQPSAGASVPASVAVMAAIPVLTLADFGWSNHVSLGLLAAACAVYLIQQWGHAAIGVRRTSMVLVLLTMALLPVIEAPGAALERGVRIGGLIASLLVTVNVLSRAALRVNRVRLVVSSLYAMPRQQRPLGLGVAAQFFGGLLGLAGLAMMMEMAARRDVVSEPDKIADFSAISRGYAALSLWSPMYSNMSIVLALYPGARWTGVLPYALAIAAGFIALGSLLDRLQRSIHKSAHETREICASAPWDDLLRPALPVLLAMVGFVGFMVAVSQGLNVPISAVIISSAPVAAWFLHLRLASPGSDRCAESVRVLVRDFTGFGAMAGEVMMFLASGCAGTVMGAAIPAAWTTAAAQIVGGSPYIASLLITSAIILLSGTAIHPMLSAVLVGSSLSPVLLGLPVATHLCAVLVGWGLAIIVSPYSVLSLMASRFSGIPLLVISLRANLLFVLLGVGGSALLLGLTASLTQP